MEFLDGMRRLRVRKMKMFLLFFHISLLRISRWPVTIVRSRAASRASPLRASNGRA